MLFSRACVSVLHAFQSRLLFSLACVSVLHAFHWEPVSSHVLADDGEHRSQVCTTTETGACEPFKSIIRVEDDRVNGKLPTMSVAKFVIGMCDQKEITLIPGWGFKLQLTFEVAALSREVDVRYCTHRGMCTLHISPAAGTHHDPMAPLPLGVGDHVVVSKKGTMWRIERPTSE